jgi:hypothetical protein
MISKRAAALALFFVAPAIVYLLVITQGSGNLLAPDELWKAYNEYALSLLNGKLTVSAEAIRAEGLYLDGKVYMYYGILPAVLRIPLVPFLDLATVPVARLLVFIQALIAAGATQFILLKIHQRGRQTQLDLLGLIVFSLAAWFASGPWFLVQAAPLYNEPFVSGLMLVCLFAAMAFSDLELRKALPGAGRLLVYGLLAALCIHARQTMAISLVAATIVLVAWPRPQEGWQSWLVGSIVRGLPAMLLIGVSGIVYLWLNHVRFGAAGSGWQITGYGWYLIQGDTERFRAFTELGQFDVRRMLPNAMVMLVGGDTLHQALIQKLGLIFVRLEPPLPRLVFTWAAALLFALWGLRTVFGGGVKRALTRPSLWLAGCFLICALLQLAYATVTFRYHVELWPVVLWLFFYGYRGLPIAWMERHAKVSVGALVALGLLTCASAAILVDRYGPARARWHEIDPDNYANPLHPALIRAVNAPSARPAE